MPDDNVVQCNMNCGKRFPRENRRQWSTAFKARPLKWYYCAREGWRREKATDPTEIIKRETWNDDDDAPKIRSTANWCMDLIKRKPATRPRAAIRSFGGENIYLKRKWWVFVFFFFIGVWLLFKRGEWLKGVCDGVLS